MLQDAEQPSLAALFPSSHSCRSWTSSTFRSRQIAQRASQQCMCFRRKSVRQASGKGRTVSGTARQKEKSTSAPAQTPSPQTAVGVLEYVPKPVPVRHWEVQPGKAESHCSFPRRRPSPQIGWHVSVPQPLPSQTQPASNWHVLEHLYQWDCMCTRTHTHTHTHTHKTHTHTDTHTGSTIMSNNDVVSYLWSKMEL